MTIKKTLISHYLPQQKPSTQSELCLPHCSPDLLLGMPNVLHFCIDLWHSLQKVNSLRFQNILHRYHYLTSTFLHISYNSNINSYTSRVKRSQKITYATQIIDKLIKYRATKTLRNIDNPLTGPPEAIANFLSLLFLLENKY